MRLIHTLYVFIGVLFLSAFSFTTIAQNETNKIEQQALKRAESGVSLSKPRPAFNKRSLNSNLQSRTIKTSNADSVISVDTVLQKPKTMVYIENSNTLDYDEKRLPDVQLLKGDVCLRHDSAYLYCDSAYFYDKINSFTAFGHVKIAQGDTLFVYGNILHYDGNTKVARLRGRVRMVNRDVQLTTDSLIYDRNLNVGYYPNKGKLKDSLNVLTSDWGLYYPGTRIALFHGHVVGTNPDVVMHSDTLKYQTQTKVATILGPTTIVHKGETTIYSENGWYDTSNGQAELLLNSYVEQKDGKMLLGDTIFYDRAHGFGKAFSNVELRDTSNNVSLFGNYGFFQEKNDAGFVTKRALMTEYSSKDTLYLNADTIFTFADAADTSKNVIQAYYNVRFYRNDLQGVCDSMVYTTSDSILQMLKFPVLWSENKQISGDTVRLYSADSSLNRILVIGNVFVSENLDSVHFNQLSGKKMIGYIEARQLRKIETEGNAESLFFPKDSTFFIGMNQTQSSFIDFYFTPQGKFYKVVPYPSVTGTMKPMTMVTKENMYLRNFSWQAYLRPYSWQDIFARPKRKVIEKVDKQREADRKKEIEERKQQRENLMNGNANSKSSLPSGLPDSNRGGNVF